MQQFSIERIKKTNLNPREEKLQSRAEQDENHVLLLLLASFAPRRYGVIELQEFCISRFLPVSTLFQE
jgi:hypothetical protein